MSTLDLHRTFHETGAVRTTMTGVKNWRGLIVGFALGSPVFFYALLIAVPAIRYGHQRTNSSVVTAPRWIAARIILAARASFTGSSTARSAAPSAVSDLLIAQPHLALRLGGVRRRIFVCLTNWLG